MEEGQTKDLLALIEQDGFQSASKSTSRGGQWNGSCPWCRGHDRFRIQPHYGLYGWFACAQCGRKGSAVDYLMLYRGLSKQEALWTVGWQPKDGSIPHAVVPVYAHNERPQWDEPPAQWQDAARDFYQACQRTLWSDTGQVALNYLRGRGLTDNTIQKALLGYHARECYSSAYTRGKAIKLWQGIVIPWIAQGQIWRITIRDERVATGDGRYKQLGGGSNGLYLADSLTLKRPVVIVTEGEFDALSVAQECGSQVATAATGTTQGAHTPRWLALLAIQRRVLIGFDAGIAGDIAANWWLARLSNAQRLRPWWDDANQMLQDGVNLHEWISTSGWQQSS